jgi:tetratricopeptide (TPR) repeat protein
MEPAPQLPLFLWEEVLQRVTPLQELASLSAVCRDMRDVITTDYFMVRYWRQVLRVWDVLRYKRDDESWPAFCQRAESERMEHVEKVLKLSRKIGEVDSDATNRRLAALLTSQRGLVYLTNLRDFGAAYGDFERAVKLSEESVVASALNNLAVTHLYVGNLSTDISHYRRAEECLMRGHQTTTSSVSAGNLCVALIKQGRFEEALVAGRVATRLARTEQPHNPNAFHHQGFALYCLSMHEYAIKYLNCAIKWKPTYSEAHFTRGLALLALGRREEANRDFERALQLSRESSVWLYCHMYASSGNPTHEGFAPRQRAPNSLEWLEQESAEVEALAEDQPVAREEQERLWMNAFIDARIGRLGGAAPVAGDDDDDDEEEGDDGFEDDEFEVDGDGGGAFDHEDEEHHLGLPQ